MLVANESVTVTFAKNEVPVFDTRNVAVTGEPAATDTPGAVFASSPLSDFTMLTPEVAGANAYASSVSDGGGNGRPSAPTAGVVPSANTGVPDTEPVFRWAAPGARAATVPVHVTLAVSEPAGPNNGITFGVAGSAPGQVRPVANESVTVTFARYAVPVLVTRNVTDNGAPAATLTPGAEFASSSLSDFTMVTPEVAGANAYASSVSDGGGNGRPSAPNAGVDPSANTGVPDTEPVFRWVAPGARAATVPVHVTLAVSEPAGPNNKTTFAVAGSAPAPAHVIPVANESVTVTFAKNDVPVFDTTNVTDNGAPAPTLTPGAEFASSPFSDFTMVTPEVAGANAYASSVSVCGCNG